MNNSTTPNSTPPRLTSGKLIIGALLALGVTAALGSWTYYARLQRRPLEFWGTDTARLIARAPRAETLLLEPLADFGDEATSDRFSVGTQSLIVREKRDVVRSPGFSNIRAALLNATTLGESRELIHDPPSWRYALRFSDGTATATVVFSGDGQWTAASDGDAFASLQPAASEFANFLREQFPRSSGAAATE